jgi:membrane associated rhomboid family serine protease
VHYVSDDHCCLVRQVLERPATSLVSTLLIAVYLYITSHGIGYAEVGLNYDLAVQKLELWRIVTAQISHVELLHLLFNLSTLWSLGIIEESNGNGAKGGTIFYLQTSLVLLIFSGLVRDTLCLDWSMLSCY